MPGSYRILTFADQKEWRQCLQEVQADDIFFSPEYLKCNEILYNGQAECFVYQGPKALIVYPYILCPIEGTAYFDITSAYGFGGFVGWPRYEELDNFRNLFRECCQKRNIVTEFIRFHPFYANHYLAGNEVDNIFYYQDVIYSRTDLSLEEFNKSIKKEAWKKIKKAIKRQLVEINSLDDYYFYEFVKIYYMTMNRLNAAGFYFFPEQFFNLMKLLMSKHMDLFLASHNGEIVGGLLIISSKEYSYNFLSGSKLYYNSLGVNDFLQYYALSWVRQEGKKKHMLGGGLKGEDSLFKFKAKFSPFRLNYYIGKIVYLPSAYEMLCNKLSYDASHIISRNFQGWFPAYRIPQLQSKKNEIESL